MQEDKGLQEVAEKYCQEILDEGRITRTVVRGEPRSYQFSQVFLAELIKQHEELRNRGISIEKILRGLEYQLYNMEAKYKTAPKPAAQVPPATPPTQEVKNVS